MASTYVSFAIAVGGVRPALSLGGVSLPMETLGRLTLAASKTRPQYGDSPMLMRRRDTTGKKKKKEILKRKEKSMIVLKHLAQ